MADDNDAITAAAPITESEFSRATTGAIFLGWLHFVVVYAYYCGALVMFFTAEPKEPFQTLR